MPYRDYLDNDNWSRFSNKLAMGIGINAAIVIQAIHKWLVFNEKAWEKHRKDFDQHFFNGRWWTYNTYAQWQSQEFPYWSTRTVIRAFAGLQQRGLILCRATSFDNYDGNWVTIDYENLDQFVVVRTSPQLSTPHDKVSGGSSLPPRQVVMGGVTTWHTSTIESKRISQDSFPSPSDEDDVPENEPPVITPTRANPYGYLSDKAKKDLAEGQPETKPPAGDDYADMSGYSLLEKWIVAECGASKAGLSDKQRERLKLRRAANAPNGSIYEEHSPAELWDEEPEHFQAWCSGQVRYSKTQSPKGRISPTTCISLITDYIKPVHGWIAYATRKGVKLNIPAAVEKYVPSIGMEAPSDIRLPDWID